MFSAKRGVNENPSLVKTFDTLNQWFSKWSISTPRGQLDHPRGR